ncbi:MAG: hypothetical protein KC940_09900 [Candidatus Omnitrophica bacterium]|nr:hypothetical protein [Candidatus Omnitrophota bacterium]
MTDLEVEAPKTRVDWSDFRSHLLKEILILSILSLVLYAYFLQDLHMDETFLFWIPFSVFLCAIYIPLRTLWFFWRPSPEEAFRFAIPAGAICFVVAAVMTHLTVFSILEHLYRKRVYDSFDRLGSVEKALKEYLTDWGVYPEPYRIDDEGFLPPSLTSPIRYLEVIPVDPFRYETDTHPPYGCVFGYWVASATKEGEGIRMMVFSLAPDGWRDLPSDSVLDASPSLTRDSLYRLQYHPSNGVTSLGDFILWAGPGGPPGNADQVEDFWSSH